MADIEAVRSVLTRAPHDWLVSTLAAMPRYGIDTPNEASSYLATVAWESREFTRLEENLNYSAERLPEVWSTRFYLPPDLPRGRRNAHDYARAPEKLAEYVYGGRGENRPEGTGDGWKYRGRGPGQLTFSRNYRRAQEATGHRVWENPDLMFDPGVGSDVTAWFWKDGGFDKLDDDSSIRAETRRWQGGTEALARRQRLFDNLQRALA